MNNEVREAKKLIAQALDVLRDENVVCDEWYDLTELLCDALAEADNLNKLARNPTGFRR